MGFGNQFLDRPIPPPLLPNGQKPSGTWFGLAANRPPASYQNCGFLYVATDTGVVYASTGTKWISVSIAFNPVSAGPFLSPYSPLTLPIFIDIFWQHFNAKPWAYSGQNGYAANQGTTGSNLSSTVASGSISFPVTTGTGVNFVQYEPVAVGDGFYNWQVFLIDAISGDNLTLGPKANQSWPNGSYVTHLWGNDTHPSTTFAIYALEATIGNMLMRKACGGTQLMPPNGAGLGNDLGSMEDQGTDINSVANVPHGWVSFNTPADITITQSAYGPNSTLPGARTGKGIEISAVTASGSGIKTTVPIPVTSGVDYQLTWQMKVTGGTGFKVVVVDANATSITIATYIPASMDNTYLVMGSRTGMVFTVPPGTTALQIQIISQAASDITYYDDFQLQVSRQGAYQSRYAIEQTQGRPICLFGDSWGVNQYASQLQAVLQNRLGALNVINNCVSGTTSAQMLANIKTTTSQCPAYAIMMSGFINDLVQNVSQSTSVSNMLAIIDQCRQNGIIPVILGAAPSSNAGITGGLATCAALNDALRNACASLTK